MNQPYWGPPGKGEIDSLDSPNAAGMHATRLAVLSYLCTGAESIRMDIEPEALDGRELGITDPLTSFATDLNRALRDPFERYRFDLDNAISLHDDFIWPQPGSASPNRAWRKLLAFSESSVGDSSSRSDPRVLQQFFRRLLAYSATLMGTRDSVPATIAASLILRLTRMADRSRRFPQPMEFGFSEWIAGSAGRSTSDARFWNEFQFAQRDERFSTEEWQALGLGFERRTSEIFEEFESARASFEPLIQLSLARRSASRFAPDAASRELSRVPISNLGLGRDAERGRISSMGREASRPKSPDKTMRRFKFARPSPTSLAIHGTWGYVGSWWRPRLGDFHGFARGSFAPEIYSGNRPFSWSGSLSERHREAAADMLHGWVADCPSADLELAICHSFGGDIAAKAHSRSGSIRQLMLLSSPITYDVLAVAMAGMPTVLVRTKWDLVVLASGFRSRFPNELAGSVREIVLDRNYLSHSASHDPAVWEAEDILGQL